MKRRRNRRYADRQRALFAEPLECRHLLAGPYAPAAGLDGSTAIDRNDSSLVAWASSLVSYAPGSNVDEEFKLTGRALGPAIGASDGTVSLGRGGSITLAFDDPIRDGLGFDFAVFENGISDTFLELGFVEVSSDGVHFVRFPSQSRTPSPVDAFGSVDPTNVHNLAGKYRQGFGTPFDLQELRGVDPWLDTTRVSFVRIVDVVGDGTARDSAGRVIYDPYPTVGSAGFDLDAVGVLHQADVGYDVISFEDVGATLASGSAFRGPDPQGVTGVGPFEDVVVIGDFESETLVFNNVYSEDYGSWNQWAYSNVTNNITPGYINQFGAIPGVGGMGTATFGVGFVDQGDFFEPPSIRKAEDDIRRFSSLLVTNTTYAALSMRSGDSFAKKFGGTSGSDPDFFLLTITGKDASGLTIGKVDHYLADYRFADNSKDYIVDDWNWVDLSPIATASSLEFSIDSSDVGPFGINTPSYFAVDEITMTTPAIFLDLADAQVSEAAGAAATTARVSRGDSDTSLAVPIQISASNPTSISLPSLVTIPVGQPYVEFSIGTINNSVVQGDRATVIRAASAGMLGSERSLLVQDDDVRSLSLTFDSSTLQEGGTGTGVISRNDADVSKALVVELETSEPSLVALNGSLTIPAGKSSVAVMVNALEDQTDRPNTVIDFVASAAGYLSATNSINLIDNDPPVITVSTSQPNWTESVARPTGDMEDLGRSLAPESFYHGADSAGGFNSRGLKFNNDYDATFGSWSGWSYSNQTDTSTPGYENQFSVIDGQGAAGSDTYLVAAAYGFPALPGIQRDPGQSTPFHSIEISNTTYAALSMLNGDAFAKKFGGESGSDPDWLLLTIEGFNGSQQSIGTIDFYLADYRFADDDMDYIVDDWTEVSLQGISQAVELRFSMSSSDVGPFGMNTPAYFAADNIVMRGGQSRPTITISRNAFDLTDELQVRLESSDRSELRTPKQVVIPSGSASVEIEIEILDDPLVDGTQVVEVTALADGYGEAVLSLSVLDDDQPELSLTLHPDEVSESGGVVRAVIHRNVVDLTLPLTVELTANPTDELELVGTVTILAGQRSAEVLLATNDNDLGDGDRTVLVRASVMGFESSDDTILIVDDEKSLRLELDRNQLGEGDAGDTVMFEDVGSKLPPRSYDNGADGAGGFTSGGVSFNNSYDAVLGTWAGWALSKTTDQVTPGYENQYSSIAGGGAFGSDSYAVASAFPGGMAPSITINDTASGQSFESIMITNTTYAAMSMVMGDDFAKRFGGESGDDPDFLFITIEGIDIAGETVGSLDFYLADYRFTDNGLDYLVDSWQQVDLTSLVGAVQLNFSLSSSDIGPFGLNTPAYFAVDHILISDSTRRSVRATVYRSGVDLSESLVVNLASDDETELRTPVSVTIPAGSDFAQFQLDGVDDTIVDGTQQVAVQATADSYLPALVNLQIVDDEQPGLRVLPNEGAISVSELRGEHEIQVALVAQPLSDVVLRISSIADDFVWSPTVLTYTPDDWNIPQVVNLQGIPDLQIEGDESHAMLIAVDSFESDELFSSMEATRITVEVLDSNPSLLRISEDATHVALIDEQSGVEILSGSLSAGIRVVGNENRQHVSIDELTQTSGSVYVEVVGGDDHVTLRGRTFDFVDGGDGFDSLELNLNEPIEFTLFLDQRIDGFEEYVVASDSGAGVSFVEPGLRRFARADGSLVLRVAAAQFLAFHPAAILVDPMMHGDDFAQVVEQNDVTMIVVSAAPWQNVRMHWDVNGSGDVTSLDALAVVNELARRDDAELPAIASLDEFRGFYFDVSGDGLATALDALRVINEMARRELQTEFESTGVGKPIASSWPCLDGKDVAEEDDDTSTALMPVMANPPAKPLASYDLAPRSEIADAADQAIVELGIDDVTDREDEEILTAELLVAIV